MFLLLGGVFAPFFVAIFQFPGLAVAYQYLSVLKWCRPDSRITFTDYRNYNLNRTNKRILDKITAYAFNADEANGILNIAIHNRNSNVKLTVFAAIMTVILSVFAFYSLPYIMAVEGETDETLKLMLYFPRAMAAMTGIALLVRPFLIRTNNKYIRAIKAAYSEEHMREREMLMDGVISGLRTKTMLHSIKLTAKREPVTVFSSMLGGTPYIPPGFIYPKSPGGRPLRLLAQLNFDELPRIEHFPDTGILQFYIADDDIYGADFKALTEQKKFRVVYHPEIIKDLSRLDTPPRIGSGEDAFPFDGEFALHGEAIQMPMSSSDFRFNAQALSMYNTAFSTEIQRFYDLPDYICEQLFEEFNGSGHRVDGYPFFTQTDPREDSDDYSEHTVLLLQIDSDDEIIWGDSGVANFFITPEKLNARDFNDVIYIRDCY